MDPGTIGAGNMIAAGTATGAIMIAAGVETAIGDSTHGMVSVMAGGIRFDAGRNDTTITWNESAADSRSSCC